LLASRFAGLEGRPIRIHFRPVLTVHGRELLSNAGRGQPVHAGALIRKREIVLETELCASPRELSRIFVHELFHFVWVRLGNTRRDSYGRLLQAEMAARARGELGWSAELKKLDLDGLAEGVPWREYLCESFCDTAAFLYAGCRRHDEFTLAKKWRLRRAQWFRESLGGRVLSI